MKQFTKTKDKQTEKDVVRIINWKAKENNQLQKEKTNVFNWRNVREKKTTSNNIIKQDTRKRKEDRMSHKSHKRMSSINKTRIDQLENKRSRKQRSVELGSKIGDKHENNIKSKEMRKQKTVSSAKNGNRSSLSWKKQDSWNGNTKRKIKNKVMKEELEDKVWINMKIKKKMQKPKKRQLLLKENTSTQRRNNASDCHKIKHQLLSSYESSIAFIIFVQHFLKRKKRHFDH